MNRLSGERELELANVVPFAQSLAWHEAATHVLRLSLERATSAGQLSREEAQKFVAYARENMDVAEVRQSISVVLDAWKNGDDRGQ